MSPGALMKSRAMLYDHRLLQWLVEHFVNQDPGYTGIETGGWTGLSKETYFRFLF